MDTQQEKLLFEFSGRVHRLMELCEELRQENICLRQQLDQETSAGEELRQQLRALQREFDLLKVAKTFARQPEALREAKQRVSKMVREVDKCIALLNE